MGKRSRTFHGQKRAVRYNLGTVGASESLAAAIVLANEIKTDYTAHIADTDAHTTAADETNVVTEDDASDLTSLIALVTELLTIYDAHNDDAVLSSGWAFHAAEGTDYSLTSAVAPTTLAECFTKLTDLKTKYNLHDLDDTAHGTLSANPVAAATVASVTQVIDFDQATIADITLSPAVSLSITLEDAYDGAEMLIKITSAHANDLVAIELDSTSCTAQAASSFTAADVNYARIFVIDAKNDISVVQWLVS